MAKWETVLNHSSILGEGPVWDQENNCLLWVDILQGEIHQYSLETAEHKRFSIGEPVGAVALCASGKILAALKNRLVFVDENGNMEAAGKNPGVQAGCRFNDGKCDPAGRFWIGTMDEKGRKGRGDLFVLEKDLTTSVKISNVTISNGMAWSKDSRTFYYIDTAEQNVVAYNYNISNGCISEKRVVINIPLEKGRPDGMTIDEDGMLWIALWGGWKVTRWNPATGECIDSISLPVSLVTSCTFGGKNMDKLFITSAKVGLSRADLEKQLLAGSLFVINNSGYKGISSYNFLG